MTACVPGFVACKEDVLVCTIDLALCLIDPQLEAERLRGRVGEDPREAVFWT